MLPSAARMASFEAVKPFIDEVMAEVDEASKKGLLFVRPKCTTDLPLGVKQTVTSYFRENGFVIRNFGKWIEIKW
jgi:hypothetical protein